MTSAGTTTNTCYQWTLQELSPTKSTDELSVLHNMVAYENKGLMTSASCCNKSATASKSQEESTRYTHVYANKILYIR